jgi:putative transposase
VPQARDQRRDVLRLAHKYGGMEVSAARKLKALGMKTASQGNRLAESMLDVATLREALGKNF